MTERTISTVMSARNVGTFDAALFAATDPF